MGKRILTELKQWTIGEIIFYSIIFVLFALTICIAGAILDFRIHFIIFGLVGMIAFILAAKKTFIGYILLFVCLVMYSILAYINKYFSEVFIIGLFILPHLVVEFIRWIKPNNNKPKLPQGKKLIVELAITAVLAAMLVVGAYRLFYVLQNSWLIGSAFAVCCGALFLYFTTYAEKIISSFFLLAYIALATTCWIFCAVFTDISYAAIALGMIAITFMSIRLFIVQCVLFAKTRKQSKQQLDIVQAVEKQPSQQQPEVEQEQIVKEQQLVQSEPKQAPVENKTTTTKTSAKKTTKSNTTKAKPKTKSNKK